MSNEVMIAYCGLVCTQCDGYLATQANNQAWLEELAAKAVEQFGAVGATAETVACDGCKSAGRKCGYCAECGIRACGSSRGVENCGECAEFESCERIQKFMEMVPEIRETFARLK